MPRHTGKRATPIPTTITPEMVANIKGMLLRGDRQSDIAAFFSINQGRIYEVKFSTKWVGILPADPSTLPEPGPYVFVSKVRHDKGRLAEETLARVVAVQDRYFAEMRSALEAVLREGF